MTEEIALISARMHFQVTPGLAEVLETSAGGGCAHLDDLQLHAGPDLLQAHARPARRKVAAPHVLRERHARLRGLLALALLQQAGNHISQRRRLAGAAQRMLSTAQASGSGGRSLRVAVPV